MQLHVTSKAWGVSPASLVVALVLSASVFLPTLVSAQGLPSGWAVSDIGAPAVPGAATYSAEAFAISGAGTDIWDASDQFTFAYRTLTGDGVIVARLDALDNTHPWAKAGVMIRDSLNAQSTHAFVFASAQNGLAFQRRQVAGAWSAHTAGGAGAAPVWIKLERIGATLRAFRSGDGASWTAIGSDTIAMGATVYAGLAVTSHNASTPTTVALSQVAVTPLTATRPGPLPTGWTSADIGQPQVAGSAGHDNGSFTVEGAGTDIWGDLDQFRFVYRQIEGDVDIVARVTSVEPVNPWAKAGVMFRDALTANAAHASMFVTPEKGVAFQHRPTAGGGTLHTAAGTGRAPYWVRLQRRGTVVTASHSTDGVTWSNARTMTLPPATIYVGLAVTSHDARMSAEATFDNVTIQAVGVQPNEPPTAALTAPSANATFTAPATVNIAATAADSDGTIDHVAFYAGSTLLGSDSAAPYTFAWMNVPAGSYTLSAVATDNEGGIGTSATRTITVQASQNQLPTASLSSPANGATFTAPATVTVTATASDPDRTIASVSFYAGTSLLGSDTTSPYSYTWSNVPAGTYSLTAVARDNMNATSSSAARSITVAASTGLPTGWTSADIGSPAVPGSAQHSGGAFTVTGSGEIFGTSDKFRYVYRQLTGDVEIISRVVSVENVQPWAKAGVMVRDALTATAVHGLMLVSGSSGTAYHRRTSSGAASVSTSGEALPAPYWVRLERRGQLLTAYGSRDGLAWTAVDTMTLAAPTVYVGLAVASADASQDATAVFDNVVVRTPAVNQPPTVALTAPGNGATFTAPASVTVSATASDSDGTIASVEFRAGTTVIGTDTTSPYSITWSNVSAGTYSLTAVARDSSGATTTSAARSITVTGGTSTTRRAVFTPSSNHTTAVSRYVFEVFTSGANPNTATPVATLDLGKPAPVSGEINVDVSATVNALAPGSYIATVTAIGSGGSSRSAQASFAR